MCQLFLVFWVLGMFVNYQSSPKSELRVPLSVALESSQLPIEMSVCGCSHAPPPRPPPPHHKRDYTVYVWQFPLTLSDKTLR